MANWTEDWPKEEQTNFAELISLAEVGLIAGELAQALRDIGRELKEDRSWSDKGFRYLPAEIPGIVENALAIMAHSDAALPVRDDGARVDELSSPGAARE